METKGEGDTLPEIHTAETDLAELNRLLRGLVGLPCWHIGFYGGQAFQLHLGDQVAAEHDKDLMLGSWGATFWDVGVIGYRPDGAGVRESFPVRSRSEVDASLFECAVVDATAYWPELALSIVFESEVGLYVLPDADGRDFWDVLMPDETMIKVVEPRTWVRTSIFDAPQSEAGSLIGDGNKQIRRSAVKAGLNEVGMFALGAAVVTRLEET